MINPTIEQQGARRHVVRAIRASLAAAHPSHLPAIREVVSELIIALSINDGSAFYAECGFEDGGWGKLA